MRFITPNGVNWFYSCVNYTQPGSISDDLSENHYLHELKNFCKYKIWYVSCDNMDLDIFYKLHSLDNILKLCDCGIQITSNQYVIDVTMQCLNHTGTFFYL